MAPYVMIPLAGDARKFLEVYSTGLLNRRTIWLTRMVEKPRWKARTLLPWSAGAKVLLIDFIHVPDGFTALSEFLEGKNFVFHGYFFHPFFCGMVLSAAAESRSRQTATPLAEPGQARHRGREGR